MATPDDRPAGLALDGVDHFAYPVSLSTISMVDSDFAVISDSMYPGSITVTLIGPEAYSARSDSPSDDTPALLAA